MKTTTTTTIHGGKVIVRTHGTRPCSDTNPHAAHRLNLTTMEWGCLGIATRCPHVTADAPRTACSQCSAKAVAK